MHSRRDIGRIALAGLAARGLLAQKVDGVQLGVCTYSFRSLPHEPNGDVVNGVIKAMTDCGANDCELFSPQLEPATKDRDALRQWRLTTPVAHFESVRKKFAGAGIKIFAYTLNFRDDYTDAELDKCFAQAKSLGANAIAASTTLTMARRLAPFADKHRQIVALHGHSKVSDPNEFSSPETFEKTLALSKFFRINLDIGHFTAANFDPVAYIEKQHKNITHLHIKDRKRNDGSNEPFGEGDTPIKPVLALLKQKRYPIPAFIEYEYKGAGTPVEEVTKALAYEKSALG